MIHRSTTSWILCACALLGACSRKAPETPPAAEGPVVQRESTAAAREKVSITVYNQNFGLVREIRKVPLGKGRVALEWVDVAAHIQPETVHLRGLDVPGGLSVLEQNYRYDLFTPEKLLEKYVGKKVKVYRYNEAIGREEVKEAELLSVAQGTVLRIDGEVTSNVLGRIAFPAVPDDLTAKPTLVWTLASSEPEQRVEVTYLTQNLNWSADYVFVLDAKEERGDLTGWVTLTNESGASYENAELKLVAGDLQRVRNQIDDFRNVYDEMPLAAAESAPFQEESFFEYHLYTLDRRTDLRDKEQKQVTLLEGRGVGVHKQLIFYGAAHYYRGRHGQVVSNQKVGVYLDVPNTKNNRLGVPLPKGTVRVYQADGSGAQQFIGEDRIHHTPRDEELRIKVGEAFDVVGERKQTTWQALGNCQSESAWEIELRNHKDEPVRVLVYEPIGGEWKILSSSHPYEKEDAHTFTFDVTVPARGKETIAYRARVRWC